MRVPRHTRSREHEMREYSATQNRATERLVDVSKVRLSPTSLRSESALGKSRGAGAGSIRAAECGTPPGPPRHPVNLV